MALLSLRALVLLAGTVGPESLPARLGRSVLDLPMTDSLRLLDIWWRRLGLLLRQMEAREGVPQVRVLAGEFDPPPSIPVEMRRQVTVERDVGRYRGTAGVLRDLSAALRDEEHILVCTASQCPDSNVLEDFVARADPSDGATIGAGPDGTPNGLVLLSCRALRQVPEIGYVDLKEQALPRIAASFGARVAVTPHSAARPIRALDDYIDVLRSWHRFGTLTGDRSIRPLDERWRPTFAIVEEGAEVADGAKLHDSVVLAGGRVSGGGELIRSVLGSGGVVRRGERVVDEVRVGSGGLAAGHLEPPRSDS